MIEYVLAASLPTVLCGVLAYLLFQEKKSHTTTRKQRDNFEKGFREKCDGLQKKESELSTDATELLSQLVKGGAVVVTQVIDPAQVFMYSPKDKR